MKKIIFISSVLTLIIFGLSSCSSKFKITLQTQGGVDAYLSATNETLSPRNVIYVDKLNRLDKDEIPVSKLPGNVFIGWYTSPDYKPDTFVTAPFTPEKNVTLYAKWGCEVKYNTMNGGSATTLTIGAGEQISEPSVPIREGYTFLGWYDKNDYSSEPLVFPYLVNNNITLYAKWSGATATIEYYADSSDTNPFVYPIANNEDYYPGAGVTGSQFVKETEFIIGWATSLDIYAPGYVLYPVGEKQTFTVVDGSTAFKLYAVWGTKAEYRAEITLDLDLGTADLADLTWSSSIATEVRGKYVLPVNEGESIFLPIPSKIFVSFTHWTYNNSTLDAKGINYNPTTRELVFHINQFDRTDNNKFTLKAHYNETFNRNGSSIISLTEAGKLLTEIVIPEGITSIQANAFANDTILKVLTIPSTVNSIGNSAFKGCISLEKIYYNAISVNVNTPDNEVPSASYPFYDAGQVGNNGYGFDVVLGRNVTFFGKLFSAYGTESSVDHYSHIRSIDYTGTNIDAIPTRSFYNCRKLSQVILPQGSSSTSGPIKTIGDYAFMNCYVLGGINLLENLTSIGTFAFYENRALESISIPNSVTSIGSSALAYTKALVTAKLPVNNSYTSIASELFSNSGLTTITIPAAVTTITNFAFNACTKLTNVTFLTDGASNLQSITVSAFAGCSNLLKVILGPTTSTIGDSAFANCVKLTNFVAPGLTTIGTLAFANDFQIKSINLPSSINTLGANLFGVYVTVPNVTIFVGRALVSSGDFDIVSFSSDAFKGGTTATPIQVIENCDIDANGVLTRFPYSTGAGVPKNTPHKEGFEEGDIYYYSSTDFEERHILPKSLVEYSSGESVHLIYGKITYYTVTFVLNEGLIAGLDALSYQVRIKKGTLMTDYAAQEDLPVKYILPTRRGYHFGGTGSETNSNGNDIWRITATTGTKFLESDPVNQDLTLVANWVANKYIVSYDLDDGEHLKLATASEFEVTYDAAFTLEAPIKPFHIFTEWEITIAVDEEEIVERKYEVGSLEGIITNFISNITISANFEEDTDRYFEYNPIDNWNNLTIVGIHKAIDDAEVVIIPLFVVSIENAAATIFSGQQGPYMFSFEIETDPEYYLSTSDTSNSTLTTIGDYALSNNSGLTQIELPDSVTVIGEGAFSNAAELEYVKLPHNATYKAIQDKTFEGAESLNDVDVVATGINTIGVEAFYGTISLESISLLQTGSAVTEIKASAFENSGLTEFIIPVETITIGNYAFKGCGDLESLDGVFLTSATRTYGTGIFEDCVSLTKVVFPNYYNSVTAMNAMFKGCTALVDVQFSTSSYFNNISANMFQNTGLSDVSIPSNIILINSGAFDGISTLKIRQNGSLTILQNAFDAAAVALAAKVSLDAGIIIYQSVAIDFGYYVQFIDPTSYYVLIYSDYIGYYCGSSLVFDNVGQIAYVTLHLFGSEGGSFVGLTEAIIDNTQFVLPDDLTKNGFTFGGWFDQENNGNQIYNVALHSVTDLWVRWN